jgi:hypothetical protein
MLSAYVHVIGETVWLLTFSQTLHFKERRFYTNRPSGFATVYPKASGLSHNEMYAYLWYYSLRSNRKGFGGKTHYTYSHRIAVQLHLVAFAVHAPGGQPGNFWIHPRM